ncbi:DUF2262 domain-containing protein [Bacillus sp. NPDC077027]|uniref:DUF2262 domain-containing protein n=1 Tax=Bacillus sp. NPDC077027 TaxID=3390548 RepID=UPI003CFCCBB6
MKKEQQINKFEERFSEEPIEIVAVTGLSGVGAGKAGSEPLWTASIPIIEWKEKDTDQVMTDKIRLCWLTDDYGLREKQAQLHQESIVKLLVRKGEHEMILMSIIDNDTQDDELQTLLEEAQKPIYYHDDKLGAFKLVKGIDLFETNVKWGNQESLLYFNLGEDEEINDCLQTARQLVQDQDKWDATMKSFAAKDLLAQANEWNEHNDTELNDEDITYDLFMSRITLESLQTYPNGEFEALYHDGDLFWGHIIIVRGHINGSFESANIAG